MLTLEIDEPLTSRDDLRRLADERPILFSDEGEAAVVEQCAKEGLHNSIIGHLKPEAISLIGPEMREHFMANGINSRQRAVIDHLCNYLDSAGIAFDSAVIYGHEAITPLAKVLRGAFVRYIGTEYAPDAETKKKIWPIQHGDVCNSDFSDNSFDAIISCEVFEHIPSIDDALREAARTLKPGGRFIGTFPFLHYRDDSVRLAALVNGDIDYLIKPPIYHGNPMDPNGGSLVFELPAWDILPRARQAGFKSAAMRFVCSSRAGIVGSHLGEAKRPRGVFLAVFDK